MKQRIGRYLDYSAINFGKSLLTMTVGTYILYFYTDVLLLPLGLVTVALFLIRLIDGAIDPAIGYYMDRHHSKYGKYRGYIILFALPACILHMAMFAPPPLSGTAMAAYCFALYLLWAVSSSFIECAHGPMLITLDNDPAQRRVANTVQISLAILAALAASFLPLPLVDKLGHGSERRGFAITMALFALVALGTILPSAKRLKEYNVTHDNKLSVKPIFNALIHNRQLLLIFIMYLCSQIGNSIKSQVLIYYMKYNLNRADLTAILMLVGVFSSLAVQPLIVRAAKRAGNITVMFAGYIGSCLGLVVIGVSGPSIVLLFAGNILFGIMSALPGNLIHVYTANLAEGLSKENSFGGLVVSLLGLSARIGQAVSGTIVSGVLYITGYVANTSQSPAALTGIWICLSGLTLLPYLISMITAGITRKIDNI